MKDGFIKVCAATPDIRVADCEYNARGIIERIKAAADCGAKVIVLPELCITGYTCGDLFLQNTLLSSAKAALTRITAECAELDIVALVGLPIEMNQKLYNCAAVMHKGQLLGIVPKVNIPNYGEFYEKRHFSSGAGIENQSVDINGASVPFGVNMIFCDTNMPYFTIGAELCEDLWSVTPPSNNLATSGAVIICNLSASNELIAKDEYRASLVSMQSARLFCAYLYSSAGEGESSTDLVFSGDDIICENGVCLARSERFANDMIFAVIDVERLVSERRKNTSFVTESAARRVFFTCDITPTRLERYISRTPFVPSDLSNRQKRSEEILSIQSLGLKKRLAHTGAKTAVIGVSGGLDSTLALLVTARAFDCLKRDRRDITAVTMPCFGTTSRTYTNACRFAESLGVTLKEVNIRDAVIQHFKDIEHEQDVYDVTYENSQARMRTMILMDIANQSGGMVVGTGDMSEMALGWATYNGDHMSMYAVNAGVPKTLIRYLVDYEANRTDNDVLKETLRDILDTPVSPELLPPKDGEISQKTESLVGPYELHDFFLFYLMRFGFSPSKILRLVEKAFDGEYDREFILQWLRVFYKRFFAQQFKRSCIPDGPKIGSVALSPRGDWRMPSDACVDIWMREIDNIS